MGDVVFEHLVLCLQSGELGDETGVAGGIKDHVSESKQRETGRCGQEQSRSGNQPLAMFLELKRHRTSSWLIERLQALRTGWIKPVQGETLAVVQKSAWKMQRSFGDLSEFIQCARKDVPRGRHCEGEKRQRDQHGIGDEPAAIHRTVRHASSSASWRAICGMMATHSWPVRSMASARV